LICPFILIVQECILFEDSSGTMAGIDGNSTKILDSSSQIFVPKRT
jgi:hypothetical protein